jgi:hypothetical protein
VKKKKRIRVENVKEPVRGTGFTPSTFPSRRPKERLCSGSHHTQYEDDCDDYDDSCNRHHAVVDLCLQVGKQRGIGGSCYVQSEDYCDDEAYNG